MILGLVTLLVLVTALVVTRSRVPVELRVWQARPSKARAALGAALVMLTSFPVALLVSPLSGAATLLPGDARTHALVARAVARGLPHGWTDALLAGFPVGPHYPSLGLGAAALLIRLGISPEGAIQAVAVTCIVGAPLALYLAAVENGATLFSAIAGALFLSWVIPFNPFVGGYDAYCSMGLVSQVVCIPVVIFLIAGIFGRGPPWRATLPAVLAMMAHPQVATACLIASFVPVVAAWSRHVAVQYARATAAGLAVAVAFYGPGIATLRVPFGWPPMLTWKLVGFGADHLVWWFRDGDLLDTGRAPILTTLWLSAGFLVLRARRPAARAALAGSFATIALAVSGRLLPRLGSAGPLLLSFVQPLRMLSLVPIVAAGTVVVAIEEGAPFFRRVLESTGIAHRAWLSPALRAALIAAFAGSLLPSELAWSRTMTESLQAARRGGPCGALTPAGFDEAAVKRWVSSLDAGRLTYEDDLDAPNACAVSTNFELASSAPIAVSTGVGGHVGVLQVAFHAVQPDRAGGAARAEALGVRFDLAMVSDPAGAGWEPMDRSGKTVLFRRRGGTDYVGAGCVSAVWRGSDAALRAKLISDLSTDGGADRLLNPESLIAIETTSGEVTESPVVSEGCSAHSAVIHEVPREPGAYEARVDTETPVDVVFRGTYFPTWHVEVDGAPAPIRVTAPGFFAVRVAAGAHHVSAVVGPPRHYLLGIFASLLLAIALSLTSIPRLERFRRA